MWVHICGTFVEAREQFSAVSSVLPPCEPWGRAQVIGLGYVPLLAEPAHWPICCTLPKDLPFFDKPGACSTSQPRSLWDVVLRRNWLAVNYEEAFQM